MIRVLHVVTYMGRGGLETMLMNYYRHIDRSKIQFDFLVHRDFEADYDQEILNMGGKIYRLPRLNPFSPQYYAALDQFFSTHSYSIVHSHLDCMSAFPLYFAKKHGAAVRIAHAHSTNQDKNLKYPVKMLARSFIPQFATHLFACGEEAGRWMFRGKDFHILNNAIDAKLYSPSALRREEIRKNLGITERFVIGHIGRFHPPKNHTFLIDFFAQTVELCPNAVLMLIGGGDGQAAIAEKVRQLGLESQVLFLGVRDDVPDLLQAMDVFAFPSLYEGLPLSVIEAQAAGVPCILSDRVPAEARLTKAVEQLSLSAPASVWVAHILAYQNYTKQDAFDIICRSGYDIKQNAHWLQDFYLSGAN